MNIEKTNGDALTLALSGRLDTTTAPLLQEALLPAFEENKNVVLDFEGIEYVSSAGLRVLLLGAKTAKAAGGSQTLVHVADEVQEVFELTGFDGVLSFG
ncbi:STAS domain-containing protein [Eubacteriales bacterium OttesenSCG-928-N13]|nr:STAS domain-containing protein [Eubacteriales bacterium OttesenSCG-928-N13]